MANLAQWSNSLCSRGRFAFSGKHKEDRHLWIRKEINCCRKDIDFFFFFFRIEVYVEKSVKWTTRELETYDRTRDKWSESEIMAD